MNDTDSDHTILHSLSASAKPGQKIAIVGPTGVSARKADVNALRAELKVSGCYSLNTGTKGKSQI